LADISSTLGSALRLSASDTAIGTISAVVAVLDMKFVSTHVTTNITSRRTVGLGYYIRSIHKIKRKLKMLQNKEAKILFSSRDSDFASQNKEAKILCSCKGSRILLRKTRRIYMNNLWIERI